MQTNSYVSKRSEKCQSFSFTFMRIMKISLYLLIIYREFSYDHKSHMVYETGNATTHIDGSNKTHPVIQIFDVINDNCPTRIKTASDHQIKKSTFLKNKIWKFMQKPICVLKRYVSFLLEIEKDIDNYLYFKLNKAIRFLKNFVMKSIHPFKKTVNVAEGSFQTTALYSDGTKKTRGLDLTTKAMKIKKFLFVKRQHLESVMIESISIIFKYIKSMVENRLATVKQFSFVILAAHEHIFKEAVSFSDCVKEKHALLIIRLRSTFYSLQMIGQTLLSMAVENLILLRTHFLKQLQILYLTFEYLLRKTIVITVRMGLYSDTYIRHFVYHTIPKLLQRIHQSNMVQTLIDNILMTKTRFLQWIDLIWNEIQDKQELELYMVPLYDFEELSMVEQHWIIQNHMPMEACLLKNSNYKKLKDCPILDKNDYDEIITTQRLHNNSKWHNI